jgi:hypothetical protein
LSGASVPLALRPVSAPASRRVLWRSICAMRFVLVAAVPLACVGFLGMPTQAKGKIDRRERFTVRRP